MRVVNRVLAAVLALALAAAGGLVMVEVVAHYVGARPLVVPWPAMQEWATATRWRSGVLRAAGIAAAVVGLVLLAVELTPDRTSRFGARSERDGVDLAYTRAGLVRAVRSAADRVDGVDSASVAVGRRTVRVAATATASTPTAGTELREPVTEAVGRQLDRLQLLAPPRLVVTTRTRRK